MFSRKPDGASPTIGHSRIDLAPKRGRVTVTDFSDGSDRRRVADRFVIT